MQPEDAVHTVEIQQPAEHAVVPRAFPLARLGPGQCIGEMALIYKTDKAT